MPLSLLLAELTKQRLEWLPLFDQWSKMLANDEALLRRARGAFLRSWFGPSLQYGGSGLLVWIKNLDELQSQYLYARSHSHDSLNLMEPLAGISGALVGSLMGVFTTVLVLHWPGVMAAIFGGIMFAFALVGGLILYFKSSQTTNLAAYGFSEAVARLIEEFITFWDWFTGPSKDIVNPFLKLAREILDRIPAITAQLVGLVAIFFTRVLPWLARFLDQLPSFMRLASSSVDFVKWAIKDVKTRMLDLLGALKQTMHQLTAIFLRLIKNAKEGFKELIDAFSEGLKKASDALVSSFKAWLAGVADKLTTAFKEIPLITAIMRIPTIVEALKAALAAQYPLLAVVLSKSSSSAPKAKDPSISDKVRAETEAAIGPEPTPGLWSEWFNLRKQGILPDISTFLSPNGMSSANQSGELPSAFSVGSDLAQAIRKGLAAPTPDIFADEWRRLRKETGGKPSEALTKLREEDVNHYRNLIGAILDRLMPAGLSGYFARLEQVLEPLSEGVKQRRAELHPLLDVRTEDRLRVEVKKVRLSYRGPVHPETREMLRSFGSRMRAAWIGQEYHMPDDESVAAAPAS